MDFGDRDKNAQQSNPWAHYSFTKNFIPVTVEEISAKTEVFSDVGSLPSFVAESTSASCHSDSSEFLEAQPQHLGAIEANFAVLDAGNSPQLGISAPSYTSQLPLTLICHQTNSFSAWPNISPCHDTSQEQLNFQGETYDEVNDFYGSYETRKNPKGIGGIDDLAKTVLENCNIADLMNLPLDENIFQQENSVQDQSCTFFDDFTHSSKHNGALANQCNPDFFPHNELSGKIAVNHSSGQSASGCEYQVLPLHSKELVTVQNDALENVSFQNGIEACTPLLSAPNRLTSVELLEASSAGSQNTLPVLFNESQPMNQSLSTYSLQNPSPTVIISQSTNLPNPKNSIPAVDSNQIGRAVNQSYNQRRYFSSPIDNNIGGYQVHLGPDNSESQFTAGAEMTIDQTEASHSGPASTETPAPFWPVFDAQDFCAPPVSSVQAQSAPSSQTIEPNNSIEQFDELQGNASTCVSKATATTNSDSPPKSLGSSGTAAKICGVCGDVAKSMHFGGTACDCCKAFFRRSVQGKYWKKFRCVGNKTCEVSKENRKGCRFCRFEKCRKNGMKVSWVMTDEERLVLWKKRMTKHHQDVSDEEIDFQSKNINPCLESQSYQSDDRTSKRRKYTSNDNVRHKKQPRKCNESSNAKFSDEFPSWPSPQLSLVVSLAGECTLVPDESIRGTTVKTCSQNHPLSYADRETINQLLELQSTAFSGNSFSKFCTGNTVEASYNVYLNITEKLRTFCRVNKDYLSLPQVDRAVICNGDTKGALVLFPVLYNFNKETNSWPRDACIEAIKIPHLTADTIAKLTKNATFHHSLINFCSAFCLDVEDEGVLAMLHLLTLLHGVEFTHKFENEELVTKCREKYLHLLIRYLRFRQGEKGYLVTLPRLLSAISEAKKLVAKATLSLDTTTASENSLMRTTDQEQRAVIQPLSPYSSVVSETGLDTETWSQRHVIGGADVHHPVTTAIFGPVTQANTLLSDPMEKILQHGKRKLLALEQKPHPMYSKEETKASLREPEDGVEQRKQRQNSTVSEISLLKAGPLEHNNSLSSASKVSWSEEKIIGIQVLCEMMQYVAQRNDPRSIECLRRHLPLELIKSLAEEHSKRSDDESSNPG